MPGASYLPGAYYAPPWFGGDYFGGGITNPLPGAGVFFKIPTRGLLLEKLVDGSWITIAQRLRLEGPNAETDTYESTSIVSPRKRKAPALVDCGDVGGTLWYDPNTSTHIIFSTGLLSADTGVWRLVYADGSVTPAQLVFSGFVSAFRPTGMEVKTYLQAQFRITLDGDLLEFAANADKPFYPLGYFAPEFFSSLT
jgi:hypothetical protein